MSQKEDRIRRITQLYYSNPKVQEILLKFAQNREVVPRYFESFGKRPDTLLYPQDIHGLVKKGATSFHSSEEIWQNPLEINSDWSRDEMNSSRKSWDLLLDIDSPYLDCSKIAARLILENLEKLGVKNYSVKFSGSKGFHILVSGKAFPQSFEGKATKNMFPEWPRAICEFLMQKIKPDYNKLISQMNLNFKALEERTKLSKEELSETLCPSCGKEGKKGKTVFYHCQECKSSIQRKDPKLMKKALACITPNCAGKLEYVKEQEYFFCEHCRTSSINKRTEGEKGTIVYSSSLKKEISYSKDFVEGISGSALADLDLVLVAPRHLFRMPYSLHEKTALASVVVYKDEIDKFDPLKDANPLKVKLREFQPRNLDGEGERLLHEALAWKAKQEKENTQSGAKKYQSFKGNETQYRDVPENCYPKPIIQLLKGLHDGRKRGLFVLITFFRNISTSPEELYNKITEWNKKNDPPLKEGYVKSQIDWHLKQKKKILPPNYDNDAFYKDLGILKEKPLVKNPLVEVGRNLWNRS